MDLDLIFKNESKKLKDFLHSIKFDKNTEIEFRFGAKFPDKFSSDIPEEIFNFIKSKFDKSSSKGIFLYKYIESSDYFSGSQRISIDDTNTRTIIEKIKLYTSDMILSDSCIDIRICVSNEKQILSNDINIDNSKMFKRLKKRHRYIYKNWNYDLTEVCREYNGLSQKNYEFEIELNLLLDYESLDSLVDNCFLKLKDIIKLLKTSFD